MGSPRIGRKIYNPPVESLKGGDAAPDQAPDPEPATVHDFVELVEPMGCAPEPPRCIMKDLKARDLVWRWLSEPSAKRLGMRMYETYSPSVKQRELINSGKDAPPGVRVNVENVVKWLDDAFLATIPRRYFVQRQAMKQERNAQQTKLSRDRSALQEAARRLGATVDLSIKTWEAPELEDREPAG